MTEKKQLETQVETVDKGVWKKTLAGLALLGTLGFVNATEGSAQEAQSQERKQDITEFVVKAPTQAMPDTTISWEDATKLPGIEPGQIGSEEGKGETGETQTDEGKEKKLEVHGMVRGGSDVTPLLGSVLSNKPALMLTVDASNPQTGLGVSVIRADDFDKSMENPAGQATLVDLYRQKQFGKVSVMGVGEYAHLDKLPGADSFTPIVGCTYDAGKGRTLDTWVGHTFQEGEDVDVVRLGVTKQLDESLSLAVQGFYRSDLSKKFYGRVQANVILGKGFGAQLSFIVQEGKITPTAGVLYKF